MLKFSLLLPPPPQSEKWIDAPATLVWASFIFLRLLRDYCNYCKLNVYGEVIHIIKLMKPWVVLLLWVWVWVEFELSLSLSWVRIWLWNFITKMNKQYLQNIPILVTSLVNGDHKIVEMLIVCDSLQSLQPMHSVKCNSWTFFLLSNKTVNEMQAHKLTKWN